jgi:hypothetical protein
VDNILEFFVREALLCFVFTRPSPGLSLSVLHGVTRHEDLEYTITTVNYTRFAAFTVSLKPCASSTYSGLDNVCLSLIYLMTLAVNSYNKPMA